MKIKWKNALVDIPNEGDYVAFPWTFREGDKLVERVLEGIVDFPFASETAKYDGEKSDELTVVGVHDISEGSGNTTMYIVDWWLPYDEYMEQVQAAYDE